jgi:hypothetical protein
MVNYIGNGPVGGNFTDRVRLSGSTNGLPIIVTATQASAGTTFHTAHPTANDFTNLYVANNTASALVLYVQYGTTATSSSIPFSIPGVSGQYLHMPGNPLTNSLIVSGWTTATGGLVVTGDVVRSY